MSSHDEGFFDRIYEGVSAIFSENDEAGGMTSYDDDDCDVSYDFDDDDY